MTNCTIAGNSATGNGGGVYVDTQLQNQSLDIANSILWANSDVSGTLETSQVYLNNANIDINYSCVQNLTGTLGGVDNIAVNPQFVAANDGAGVDNQYGTADDNFRMFWTSPCIDSGSPAYLPKDITDIDQDGDSLEKILYDIDMNKRSYQVDRRAYEIYDYIRVGVICWINESDKYQANINGIYDTHLEYFNDEILPLYPVTAGCLVPPYGSPHTINQVLPTGYSAPDEIYMDIFPNVDFNDMKTDFYNIFGYNHNLEKIILIVDATGSMSVNLTGSSAYSDFIAWLEGTGSGQQGLTVIEDKNDITDAYEWKDELWINRISSQIEANF
ncbi:MAG: hypothetical protein ACIAQZ_16375 [Sedimentisphaeraceae bacterium JB056]